MREEVVLFGVVAIVVILAGVVFFPSFFGEGGFYNKIDKLALTGGQKDVPNSPPVSNGPDITGKVSDTPNSDNPNNAGSDSSGGDNTGNQDNQNNSGNCYDMQISYSIKNFLSLENCDASYAGICLEKSVNCSLIAENLDSSTGGNFGIRMYVIEQGTGIDEAIDSDYAEKFVSAGANETFAFDFHVTSQNSNGNANKDLECYYVTELIPRTQICS